MSQALNHSVALGQLTRTKHIQAPCMCNSQRAHRRTLIVIVPVYCKDSLVPACNLPSIQVLRDRGEGAVIMHLHCILVPQWLHADMLLITWMGNSTALHSSPPYSLPHYTASVLLAVCSPQQPSAHLQRRDMPTLFLGRSTKPQRH